MKLTELRIVQVLDPEKGKQYLEEKEFRPILQFGHSHYWLVGDYSNACWCRDVKLFTPLAKYPFVSRYIYGSYHCDKCPMCWSDWSEYTGDGDCGCYIYGDLRDSCRLLPPLRFLIGWPRKRKAEYMAAHEWDGAGDYFENMATQNEAMEKTILDSLRCVELVMRDFEGSLIPVCKAEHIQANIRTICDSYEREAHPFVYVSLKEDWKRLLKRTWNAFADIFRPYLPERRKHSPKNK